MKRILSKLLLLAIILIILSYVFYQFFGWQLAARKYKDHVISELTANSAIPTSAPEKLVYTLRYLGMPSGKAIMRIDKMGDYKGREAYFFSANARASDFISVFFEIEGWIKSVLDKNELNSLYFQEHSKATGHRQNDKVVTYNQVEHYLEVDGEQFTMLPDTVDPLAGFYIVRLIDFKLLEGGHNFNVKSRKRDRSFYAEYIDTEMLETPFGRLKTYKIYMHLKRVKATSKHEISGYMWITADEKRIPVSIDLNTKAGPVSARLLDLDL